MIADLDAAHCAGDLAPTTDAAAGEVSRRGIGYEASGNPGEGSGGDLFSDVDGLDNAQNTTNALPALDTVPISTVSIPPTPTPPPHVDCDNHDFEIDAAASEDVFCC